MMEEMPLGFVGHCPGTELADLFQATFELWHGGNHKQAYDMFGRIQAWGTITDASQYTLVARGVFKETTKGRAQTNPPGSAPSTGGGVGRRGGAIAESQKAFIRDAMNEYLKPYFRV